MPVNRGNEARVYGEKSSHCISQLSLGNPDRPKFLASYDPLTGLPNRRLVTEHLDHAVSVADGQVAILILNLDRFKNVNATWGRTGGDQLLTMVSDRLAKSLRLSDMLARQNPNLRTELGRLGGDEFTVLVTGVQDANEVAAIAERLQHVLGRPFKFQGQEHTTTASIGAALYPADGANSEALLRNAESAMHAARESMRGSYHFYSVAMHTSVSDRLSLEADLRQAIKRDELVLHYQPKTFTRSGHLAIEITESMIMRDTREAHETLCSLKELGVQVAIDDFGTGYSTLSSLKDLPINQLKIDRAFIKDLANSPRDVAITRAIIAMAHGLGLTVIAEGVESDEQLAVLRAEGCDEVQGFLIGQPRPGDQFVEFFDELNPQAAEVSSLQGAG